jgi:hypothetical protein
MRTIEQLRWEWIRFEDLLRVTRIDLGEGTSPESADPRVTDGLREWSGKVDNWRQQVEEMLRRYPLPAPAERETVARVASTAQR